MTSKVIQAIETEAKEMGAMVKAGELKIEAAWEKLLEILHIHQQRLATAEATPAEPVPPPEATGAPVAPPVVPIVPPVVPVASDPVIPPAPPAPAPATPPADTAADDQARATAAFLGGGSGAAPAPANSTPAPQTAPAVTLLPGIAYYFHHLPEGTPVGTSPSFVTTEPLTAGDVDVEFLYRGAGIAGQTGENQLWVWDATQNETEPAGIVPGNATAQVNLSFKNVSVGEVRKVGFRGDMPNGVMDVTLQQTRKA